MYLKKAWKARSSEYANRRILQDDNGVQTRYTVIRDEGTIFEPGDGFTKTNMDDLENRIYSAFVAEHTFLTGILTAHSTFLDFTDPSIVEGCIPHVYVPMEKSKLIPETLTLVAEHTLRLTFPEQDEDTTIKLKIETDLTP